MKTAAVIVAAGRGLRAGGDIPKQWQPLAGRRVIDWTLDAFRALPEIHQIVVVLHSDDLALLPASDNVAVTIGGETRDASVQNGLLALVGDGIDRVLIHDVARPCISAEVIYRVLENITPTQGAAPALAVSDALWRGQNNRVEGPQDRAGLFRAQTPQGFDYDAIFAAHKSYSGLATDDVEVARQAGMAVAIVAGDEENLKITTPVDFARAETILQKTIAGKTMDIRVGNGFDVHAFCDGDAVILCGVTIAHKRALLGHSDADVGMHAVTDAIYGAMAKGDIGQHFPPSDPQWRGASSDIFLRHAVEMAQKQGFNISNIDCTLICEHPKIGPHVMEMRAAMATITGLSIDRISIKATTSERLGFTGREEGIAAMATATLVAA